MVDRRDGGPEAVVAAPGFFLDEEVEQADRSWSRVVITGCTGPLGEGLGQLARYAVT